MSNITRYAFPAVSGVMAAVTNVVMRTAHAGLIAAIVTASLMPITKPATSAPMGLPSRPMMTTANMTPSQAQICDGASVVIKAM